jgi:hypothetical protein
MGCSWGFFFLPHSDQKKFLSLSLSLSLSADFLLTVGADQTATQTASRLANVAQEAADRVSLQIFHVSDLCVWWQRYCSWRYCFPNWCCCYDFGHYDQLCGLFVCRHCAFLLLFSVTFLLCTNNWKHLTLTSLLLPSFSLQTKTMKARAGRGSYVDPRRYLGLYPDPGAYAAYIWLQAIALALSA